MSLSTVSIRRPITVLMFTLIAVLIGGIAYVKLPIDLMPEIVYPTILDAIQGNLSAEEAANNIQEAANKMVDEAE